MPRLMTEKEIEATMERSKHHQQRMLEAARRFLETAEDLQLTWNEFEQVIQIVKHRARIGSVERK